MVRRTALSLLVFLLLTGRFAAENTTPTAALRFTPAQYPSDAGARAIVSADFDGDGALDFATANTASNTVDVFMNREFSSGGFTVRRYPVGAGPFDLLVSDLDVDGYPDLAVAAADAGEIDVLFGGAAGNFAAPKRLPAPGNPRGLAAGWFGPQSPSLVYSSYASGTVSILSCDIATRDFTAGPTLNAGVNAQGIAVGRFTSGGLYSDIAIANAGGSRITLLRNVGALSFTRTELAAPSGSGTNMNVLVAADFDKDGRDDLAAASTARNVVELYLNGATGLRWMTTLNGAGLSSPRGMTAADLNADGRLDLAVASRALSSVTIFFANSSAPLFATHEVIKSSSGSRAVTAGDFDGDGRVDLATGNEYVAAATVLWNRTAGAGGTGATAFELQALPDVSNNVSASGGLLAVADFNHNGIPDVVVGGGVVLDARTPVNVDTGGDSKIVLSAVVGDFNEDGHPDFAETAYSWVSQGDFATQQFVIDCVLGDGAGGFARGASLTVNRALGMIAADVNHDGHVDIVVADAAGNARMIRRVFLGRGDGTFTEIDQAHPSAAWLQSAADMNGDGSVDLILWDLTTKQVVLLLGDGAGDFPTERRSETVPDAWGLQVADLDGDGHPDVVGMAPQGIIIWLGDGDGTLKSALLSDVPQFASNVAIADFTADGRLDILTSGGTLAIGKGDGTFGPNRSFNVSFGASIPADVDRDGRPDVVIATASYAAMVLYNRAAEPPNAAPIVVMSPHNAEVPFISQFGDRAAAADAMRTYDPNLDPLLFTWMEGDKVVGTGEDFFPNLPPGRHIITLIVRDNAGAEARDAVTVTITPLEELVVHTADADGGVVRGTWTGGPDPTAADGGVLADPDANRPKLPAPLASPADYFEFTFPADPTQEYKLWIRMKAQRNSPYNDSVYVQFSGAVDRSGAPAYAIGTATALAVNLEECSGCGLQGWGWRDEAWGSRNVVGTVNLRFPAGTNGNMLHFMRIHSREDGAMIDQVVLSAKKYKSARPGLAKNDTTILPAIVPSR